MRNNYIKHSVKKAKLAISAIIVVLLISTVFQSFCMAEVSAMNTVIKLNDYLDHKYYKAVIKNCNKNVKNHPKDDTSYLYLSMEYSRLNQKKEAIENLKKALEIDENNIRLVRQNRSFDKIYDSEEFLNILGTVVKVNGKELGNGAKAIIQDNKVLVPIEAVFNAVGYKVQKSSDTGLLVSDKQNTIIFENGKKEVIINKKSISLNNLVININGMLFIDYLDLKKCSKLRVNWKRNLNTIYVRTVSSKPYYTDEQMEWALGAGGINTEMNGLMLNVLGGEPITKKFIAYRKAGLLSGWGVEDRKSALDTIKWLKDEGHSKEFDEFLDNLDKSDEQKEFFKVLKGADANKNTSLDEYKKKGLTAWDYSRLINVCESSYVLGYITYDEAWNEIMEAAKKVQKTYSSWVEFGHAYSLGRYFWSEDKDNFDSSEAAVGILISNKQSPWVVYNWNMNLNKHKAD